MSGFFWSGDHFGWGLFALLVFSALWLLLGDLGWRLLHMKFKRLVGLMSLGWLLAVAVIVLVSYFVYR